MISDVLKIIIIGNRQDVKRETFNLSILTDLAAVAVLSSSFNYHNSMDNKLPLAPDTAAIKKLLLIFTFGKYFAL